MHLFSEQLTNDYPVPLTVLSETDALKLMLSHISQQVQPQ